ncbi:MAG TPA: hypothetical protein PKA05_18670, partial [Roseiflexaceae bacterium]|nr:hypothetical protein [Roseiflexaceae bacterium]
VAQRFGLAAYKGQIALNADADLVLIDLAHHAPLQQQDLYDRHRLSPFLGHVLRARVVRTFVRGTTVFHNGRFASAPAGRLIQGRGAIGS